LRKVAKQNSVDGSVKGKDNSRREHRKSNRKEEDAEPNRGWTA
jgi:hypothetical protein